MKAGDKGVDKDKQKPNVSQDNSNKEKKENKETKEVKETKEIKEAEKNKLSTSIDDGKNAKLSNENNTSTIQNPNVQNKENNSKGGSPRGKTPENILDVSNAKSEKRSVLKNYQMDLSEIVTPQEIIPSKK
jgi:hypothetical protein